MRRQEIVIRKAIRTGWSVWHRIEPNYGRRIKWFPTYGRALVYGFKASNALIRSAIP